MHFALTHQDLSVTFYWVSIILAVAAMLLRPAAYRAWRHTFVLTIRLAMVAGHLGTLASCARCAGAKWHGSSTLRLAATTAYYYSSAKGRMGFGFIATKSLTVAKVGAVGRCTPRVFVYCPVTAAQVVHARARRQLGMSGDGGRPGRPT